LFKIIPKMLFSLSRSQKLQLVHELYLFTNM